MIADRAYEDEQTRSLMKIQGFIPMVPPKKNRKNLWEYDKSLYKRRNEIERDYKIVCVNEKTIKTED